MPDHHGTSPETQASTSVAGASDPADAAGASPTAVAEPGTPALAAGESQSGPQDPAPEPGRLGLHELLTTYRPVLALSLIAACAEAAYAAVNMLALQVFVDEVLNLTSYLGFILGAFLGVEAPMKSVMGALADRYGRKKFLAAAPIVSGTTAVLVVLLGAVVHSRLGPGGGAPAQYSGMGMVLLVLLPLLVIRAIDGVAAAAFWVTMYATMADAAPPHRRTSAMSFLTVAYMAGVALGPTLAGWANERSPLSRRGTPTVTQVVELARPADAGAYYFQGRVQSINPAEKTLVIDGRKFWTSTKTKFLPGEERKLADLQPGEQVGIRAGNKAAAFVVVSILFYLTGALALLLLPRRGLQQSSRNDEHKQPLRLADLTLAMRLAPSLVLTAMIVFIAVGALGGIGALYAKAVFHLSDLEYGRLFLVPAIVIGLLTFPLGLLGDWWGTARSVHVGIGIATAAMWAIAAVAILPPLHALRTEMVLAGLATFVGVGFVMGIPAWLTTVAEAAGDQRRAQMIGAVATSEGAGAFLGMLVGPPLFELGGAYPFMIHAPIVLAAVSLLVGFILSLFTIPPRLRQLE